VVGARGLHLGIALVDEALAFAPQVGELGVPEHSLEGEPAFTLVCLQLLVGDHFLISRHFDSAPSFRPTTPVVWPQVLPPTAHLVTTSDRFLLR
jgi:hypothetical protein